MTILGYVNYLWGTKKKFMLGEEVLLCQAAYFLFSVSI